MNLPLFRTGVVVSSTAVKAQEPKSSVGSWSIKSSAPGDSTVARYNRVAVMETVLSIRSQQQRAVRRLLVAILVVTGVTIVAAGVMGWL
jgi:hypothetical protein